MTGVCGSSNRNPQRSERVPAREPEVFQSGQHFRRETELAGKRSLVSNLNLTRGMCGVDSFEGFPHATVRFAL